MLSKAGWEWFKIPKKYTVISTPPTSSDQRRRGSGMNGGPRAVDLIWIIRRLFPFDCPFFAEIFAIGRTEWKGTVSNGKPIQNTRMSQHRSGNKAFRKWGDCRRYLRAWARAEDSGFEGQIKSMFVTRWKIKAGTKEKPIFNSIRTNTL